MNALSDLLAELKVDTSNEHDVVLAVLANLHERMSKIEAAFAAKADKATS